MPRTHSSGFASIPYRLLDQLGANKNVGWLYLWLHRHGHGSEQGSWASISTLAKECRMNPRAVKAGLRWLVDHGWAVRVSRPGSSSRYFLRMDAPPGGGTSAPRTWVPNEPQAPNTPQVPNAPQDLGTGWAPGTKRPPGPEQTPGPGYQTGPTTWVPNGSQDLGTKWAPQTRTQEQEPRKENPGTRPPLPSSEIIDSFFVFLPGGEPQKKGGTSSQAEEQPRPVQPQLDPAPAWEAPRPVSPPPVALRPVALPPVALPPGFKPPSAEELAGLSLVEEAAATARAVAESGVPIEQLFPDDFPWGGPLARKTSSDPLAEAPRLPVPVHDLPQSLQPIADRIQAYWLNKSGLRTPAAFEALIEELLLVLPAAGRVGVVELLRLATQAGWPGINARTWLNQHHQQSSSPRPPADRPHRLG